MNRLAGRDELHYISLRIAIGGLNLCTVWANFLLTRGLSEASDHGLHNYEDYGDDEEYGEYDQHWEQEDHENHENHEERMHQAHEHEYEEYENYRDYEKHEESDLPGALALAAWLCASGAVVAVMTAGQTCRAHLALVVWAAAAWAAPNETSIWVMTRHHLNTWPGSTPLNFSENRTETSIDQVQLPNFSHESLCTEI